MLNQKINDEQLLDHLIAEKLHPYVRQIDTEAFYAEEFLRALGESGFFSHATTTPEERLKKEAHLVKEVAAVCMTTAFCLWCHLASLTYIRHTENKQLQHHILTKLENGSLLGGTGLSNPLKYISNMEPIHLRAKRVEGGYIVNGALPYISNLGDAHGFAFVARANECDEQGNNRLIMGYVLCDTDGLVMHERKNYIGLNGSATYACQFTELFIADEAVISDDANTFIERVRPTFVAYQIPLSIGVITSSIHSIEKVYDKQNGCNQYLRVQADDLTRKRRQLESAYELATNQRNIPFQGLAEIRLESAYLLLDTVQTAMLHHGGAAYIKNSTPDRRLREAYFYANLTPTIKHLEKALAT